MGSDFRAPVPFLHDSTHASREPGSRSSAPRVLARQRYFTWWLSPGPTGAVAPVRRDPIWANATAAVPLPNGTRALSSGTPRRPHQRNHCYGYELKIIFFFKKRGDSFTLMRDPLHVTLSRRGCMGTAEWDTPRSRRSHVSLIAGGARDILKYLLRLFTPLVLSRSQAVGQRIGTSFRHVFCWPRQIVFKDFYYLIH